MTSANAAPEIPSPRDRMRELPAESFDAIVVGAGTGGLVSAAILARHGHRVLVLDRHVVAGGNATTFRRGPYEFDVGIHYLGQCHESGFLPRILRAAGVSNVEFAELDPDGFDTLVFPDFSFRMPRGLAAFRERLYRQFPAERRGIDRYLKFLDQVGRVMLLAGRPLRALVTLPRCLLLLRWARATFAGFLESCTADVRLRAALAGQSGDYALPPSRASSLIGAGITAHYLNGAYYPVGGGQVLSDRLAESIEANGGTILLGAEARRIVVERKRVTGVEFESHVLGRRSVRAPVVVSNADLKQTYTRLVGADQLRGSTLARVERYRMAPGLGVVFLGYGRDLVGEGHPRTNFWVYPSYDLEPTYAAAAAGELPADPFVFISIASLKDPTNRRLAPAGSTSLQVVSIAPSAAEAWGVSADEAASGAYRKSAAYGERKAEFARRLLSTARRVFPDLEERQEFLEVATPLTHARYTAATGGTSYGIAATPDQFLGGRPDVRTEIAGLYLCGASTRTGHGITGVALSGLRAASCALPGSLWRQVLGRGWA